MAISILQKETLPPHVTSLYGSLPPLPLESGSRERKGIVRTAVVQKPRSLMTNISGAQFLRGNNRAGLGDKTPFQAGGRHPRLEFCFLVPGPGRQADKRLEAQFIFWFLMRGGQGGEPALLRNMLTFSRGRCWTRDRRSNILGTSRLRTQWWPGCATLLQSTVEKMGSRPCPPFNPSSCPTGWRDVMETAAAAAARSIWKQQLSLFGRRSCHRRPAAAFRRPWQGQGGLEGGMHLTIDSMHCHRLGNATEYEWWCRWPKVQSCRVSTPSEGASTSPARIMAPGPNMEAAAGSPLLNGDGSRRAKEGNHN